MSTQPTVREFVESLVAARTAPVNPREVTDHIFADLASIIAGHEGRNRADVDLSRLVKACRVCGSITEAPDRETRDFVVANFDVTCCTNSLGEAWTVTFTTTGA